MDGIQGMRKGLVMAQVGDNDFFLGELGQGAHLQQLVAQRLQRVLVFGRDEEGGEGLLFEEPGQFFGLRGRQEVCLVEQEKQLFAFAARKQLLGERGPLEQGGGTVHHPQYDVGFVQFLVCTFDSDVFDGVVGLADAGRIDESEGDAVPVDRIFYHIAGGAVDVAYDGPFLAKQGIEEGRFPYVCFADDGDGDAVFQGVSPME